ncbi:MAG TPA: chemical-damaging agent resistance protein C [Rhodospirillaceae bacterium]|jgi:tellurium resistance protein TerD|nr:TerD family protein [Alphaproteobacteria bacterium]HBH26196.1 chemical-damaging agent resistance protein C [Rhodospirillaceae bacterium]
MHDDDFFNVTPEDEPPREVGLTLSTGQEVDLTALDPTLAEVMIGAGWDLRPFDAQPLDVDISCFLLDAHGQTKANADFIFYNNMEGPAAAVIHNGDSRTGAGEGDDETISIDLRGLSLEVARVVFTLTIHDGAEREQSLAGIRGGFLRVTDRSNGHEIARYVLDEALEGRAETGMLVAELERLGPNWVFRALGEPVEGGLAAIATRYGVVVAEEGRG